MGLTQIYTGTSGLVLPVPNKLSYPTEFQEKSRLCYYASLFNSIEVNSSFYKIPMAATMKKWADDVTENFKFTFKLFREITHNKQLAFNPQDLELFMQRINCIGNKKGCLLIQFPPSLGSDNLKQFDELLQNINNLNADEPWKVAIEFRNRSWYQDDVYDLIDQYGYSLVIHDIPASATPMRDDLSADVYVRFHGPSGGYRGSYSDDFLYEYAGYIKDWQTEGKTVYVYFNNTMGSAVQNLMTLNKYLAE